MPKRILLPILITTTVFGIGTGTYVSNKSINSYAQTNSNQRFNPANTESVRTLPENFVGQKPRSDDFTFAKNLGVDTSKLEEAQTKSKEAENNLKVEMQNIRLVIKDAIISKAEEKNVSSVIIENYSNSYQKLEESKNNLKDKLSKDDSTIQTIKDLRTDIRDNMKNFKAQEIKIKEAIK
jgi:hypothetical protein